MARPWSASDQLAAADLNAVTLPPGVIMPYGASSAPTGWLVCDGSAVSQATYAALYAIIGLTFGNPGGGNFNLPNLKGKVPVGYDAAESEFDAMAEAGGEKTHVLTEAELASHHHGTGMYANIGGSGLPIPPVGNANTEIQTTNVGSNTAHNNLQPYITLQYIIKT